MHRVDGKRGMKRVVKGRERTGLLYYIIIPKVR